MDKEPVDAPVRPPQPPVGPRREDAGHLQAPVENDREADLQRHRPVLAQHCYSCQSVEADRNKKLQARLFLDTAEGTLTGGENGPALVKGKSAESLMIKALKYDGLEMPPSGRLSDEVIADFVR